MREAGHADMPPGLPHHAVPGGHDVRVRPAGGADGPEEAAKRVEPLGHAPAHLRDAVGALHREEVRKEQAQVQEPSDEVGADDGARDGPGGVVGLLRHVRRDIVTIHEEL